VADIISFHRGSYGGSKEVWVSLSNGFTGFGASKKWVTGFCMQSQEVCMTGDFNDDNYDDIITFHHGAWNGSKQVFVYLSNGSSNFYYPGSPWHNDFCPAGEICEVGDVDADGDDDIISFQRATGDVYVALSNGSSFDAKQKWHDNICSGKQIICTVGDVDGDKQVDLLAFTEAPYTKYNYIPGVGTIPESCTAAAECGDVYVTLSKGKSFGESLKRHGTLDHKNAAPLVGRISSDGRLDVLFIRDNSYVVLQSTLE
jgi:FG-GAP-like repeat